MSNVGACRTIEAIIQRNEETAQDIYRHIKKDYIGLLQVLDQEVCSGLDI
ncbi:hypothetical protein [Megasphaera sp. UBA4352]|uniref:Uncharacterized protein n=1 Tax=Megasphaera hexanoica TaxID=1675036 RepID=A0ABW7DQP5_9FIRM